MTRIICYLSGPVTNGETLSRKHIEANVQVAMKAQHDLFRMGFGVICPHLSWYSHQYYPEPYETYMANSLAQVAASDFVWRLPGESKGADIECAFAIDKRIPVYRSRQEIAERFELDPLA